MKVISIYGGPRKKGNTATILTWVEEELALLGHSVERINMASKSNRLNDIGKMDARFFCINE